MNSVPAHILIVDDDDRLRSLLKRFLHEEGFVVSTAASASEAREVLALLTPDLMVLDVMMPGETGIELAQKLNGKNIPPILMLSARSEPADRITGFEAGVDDYLTKPFEPKELILRIRAILRRRSNISVQQLVTFGEFSFDLSTGQLSAKGEAIYLTTAESTLLKLLAERVNEALSREELAKNGGLGSERAVDVQITRIRKKIEPEGRPLYIQTVRGSGYSLLGSKS